MSAMIFPAAAEQRETGRAEPRVAAVDTLPDALSDAQWAAIAPLLPPTRRTGRRRSTDMRLVVTAINHHWRTGCPWRKLPSGFPPWPTIYTYFRNWIRSGFLRQLRTILNPPRPSELAPSSRQPGRPPAKLHPHRRSEERNYQLARRIT